MKSTFRILFYAKWEASDEAKMLPIYVRITINGSKEFLLSAGTHQIIQYTLTNYTEIAVPISRITLSDLMLSHHIPQGQLHSTA